MRRSYWDQQSVPQYCSLVAPRSAGRSGDFRIIIRANITVLHTFTGDDGLSPYAGVTVDHAGNLYGTTKYGGVAGCDLGCGVVFKVTPQGSGWNFVSLYKFIGPSDGKSPVARVVFGRDGRLYGTTF